MSLSETMSASGASSELPIDPEDMVEGFANFSKNSRLSNRSDIYFRIHKNDVVKETTP